MPEFRPHQSPYRKTACLTPGKTRAPDPLCLVWSLYDISWHMWHICPSTALGSWILKLWLLVWENELSPHLQYSLCVCVFVDVPVQTSSPPSSPVVPDPPSPLRNHITVAKKQQWAKQGAGAPPTYLCIGSSHKPHSKEGPAVTAHDIHGNTRRQSPQQDQVQ